jgi:hypothetical protein
MAKAGPGSSPVRIRGGRSYWTLDALSAEKEAAKPRAKSAPRGKQRFLEPQRLSDDQRTTLLAALAEAGVGDDESRGLFAAALEYDLARFPQLAAEQAAQQIDTTPPAAEESAQDQLLLELAQGARALAERLQGLDAPAMQRLQQALTETDRFRRGYDNKYIECLREELMRIAAMASVCQVRAKPAKPKRPPVTDAERQLLQRLADAFSDCFEMRPTPDQGPFVLALAAVTQVTGIRLPTDAKVLKDTLAGP